MRNLPALGALFLLTIINGTTPAKAGEPLVRFGVIADIQYCDCDPWYGRHYRASLDKLQRCVEQLNREDVLFTINLGDLIDRDFADMDTVLHYLNGLYGDIYNLIGNHDYAGVDDNTRLFGKLTMPCAYYAFEYTFKCDKWVFILLDTNDVATYSNMDPDKAGQLKAMREEIERQGRDNGQSWNGGVGRDQMKWLEIVLGNAQQDGKNVMIFTHHPLYPFNDHTALNDKEVLDLLTRYPCVRAVMSGHNHAGGFGRYGDLPCVTVKGMVEQPDGNSFCIVDIYDDKIVIDGYGYAESYVFEF